MKKIFYFLLSVLVLCFTFSCELNLPTISDSGTIPYQRPETPENVKVFSGNKDKIVLTWDPVQNASYYVVEGAVSSDFGERFSVFGNTTSCRFEIDRSSEIRSDKSYIFTIRAVTRFGNGESFASLNSDYVEGALAPESKDIQFYSVVTNDTVSAYWNIPTFFSTLHGDKVLYDAEFSLGYKLVSDKDWKEIKGSEVNPDPDKPWMFHQIDINRSNLQQNEDYLFRIGVEIKDDSTGDTTVVYSNPINLIIHSDKLPSPIAELKASTGSITGIDLSWTVPDWTLPLDATNCFFKIERAPEGTEDWVTVLDEIKAGVQVDDEAVIKRTTEADTGIVSVEFHDVNSEENDIKGKNFIYRITNAAYADSVMYVQEENLTVSGIAHMYNPGAITLNGGWTTNADDKATVNFTYGLENAVPEGVSLSPAFISEIYTPESKKWTVVEGILNPGDNAQMFGATGTYKAFRYFFELRDSAGNSYIERMPVVMKNLSGDSFMKVPGLEGTFPVLGNTFPSSDRLIDNIEASDNRLNKIVITLDELQYESDKYSTPYHYTYSEDNGSSFNDATFVAVGEPVTENGVTRTRMQFVIDAPAKASEDITIKVSSGKYVDSGIAANGAILAVPADIVLDVESADGNSFVAKWNTDTKSTIDKVSYAVVYKEKSALSWTDGSVVDFASGEHTLDLTSLSAGSYEFALGISNSEYSGEGTAYGTAIERKIIAPVSGIKASKGEYSDKVVVSWTPVTGADGYRIYSYTDSISNASLLGEAAAGDTSYEHAGVSSETSYYVTAFIKAVEGRHDLTFPMEKNPIGNDEAANKGYVFGTASLEPKTASYLTSEKYLKPYFTVTLQPEKFIPVYVITATADDISYEFNLSEFTASGIVRTNGKTDDEVGYAEYNPSTNTFKANVRFNYLNDSYRVDSVAVTGKNGSNATDKFLATGETARSLGERDYAALFNLELKSVISAANSSFDGDWYKSPQGKYDKTGISIGTTWSDTWTDYGYNGYIKFTDFKGVGADLNSTVNINIVSTNGGGAGYLGKDPLNVIGTNNAANKTTVTPKVSLVVNGKQVAFEPAEITVNNISKSAGWTGSYKVSIGGGPVVDITMKDPAIKVKPF